MSINVSFDIYNEDAVTRIVEENPDLLPDYSVDISADLEYNKRQINSTIEAAIQSGDSIDTIAETLTDRLETVNENSAIKTARTAITSAQNGGTLESFYELQEMGINVQKQWVATLDSRTRPSHQEVDGEIRDLDEEFSNGLQYPGDPNGDPSEVYNCRCTMVAHLPDYDSEEEGIVRWSRDLETGEREYVSNMTYKEWLSSKKYASEKNSSYGYITITQSAIDNVPYVEIKTIGESASKEVQTRCKEVLTKAAEYEDGTEVGMLCDMDGNKISIQIGEKGQGRVKIPTNDSDCITIHNHPDGQIFSGTDLTTFFEKGNLIGMNVVGNNGTIYSLFKKDNYDGMVAYNEFVPLTKKLDKLKKEGNIGKYIQEIINFLKESSKYGVEFNQRPES